MWRFIRFLFILIFVNQPVWSDFTSTSFGLGFIDENVRTYQEDVSGNRNIFNFRVQLEAQTYYDLFEDSSWFIIPSIGIQFPQSTEESTIKKYRYFLAGNVGYSFNSSFMLRAGGSLYFTHLTSDGGTSTLPNGTGTTDFPLPPESSTAMNLTTNIAAEYFIDQYSIKSEVFILNLTDSLKRTFSYSITAHYHFEDLL
jgi:hypothetical protein